MQLIGFNFTKISAERKQVAPQEANVDTNIEFLNVTEEKMDLLKDKTSLKVHFSQVVTYGSPKEAKKQEQYASLTFEGIMSIAATSDEARDLLKSWKKKELPNEIKFPLFNIILAKCSVKSLQLQEELSLPFHPQLPRLTPQQKAN